MSIARKIEGQLSANGMRFALVAARFNSYIVDHLVNGAIDTLVRHGAARADITLTHVPGSFEIPLACQKLAESKQFDAVVALGCVIRGETSHYDHVCDAVAKGVSDVALATSVPVAFGVITTENIEQAIARAGCKAGNKGADAALAAIEMANLVREVDKAE